MRCAFILLAAALAVRAQVAAPEIDPEPPRNYWVQTLECPACDRQHTVETTPADFIVTEIRCGCGQRVRFDSVVPRLEVVR